MPKWCICAIVVLLSSHVFAQKTIGDTVSVRREIVYSVFKVGNKVGFKKSYCTTYTTRCMHDDRLITCVGLPECIEEVVISPKLKYRLINGYACNCNVYTSKVTTVKNKVGKWAVYDSTFHLISEFKFDLAIPIVGTEVAAVKVNDRWGFISSNKYLEPIYYFVDHDNGETPYEEIPFDGGALWMEMILTNNYLIEQPTYFQMLNGIDTVYINSKTLEELKR